MSFHWDDMDYWKCGEWQVVQERLDDLDAAGVQYCPARENLFAALDATPFDKVKVAVVGQDPYPNTTHATGIAFSVPKRVKRLPPTLQNILKEYSDDLHYPAPSNGNLDVWASRGVLLWNATPSCEVRKPGSHNWLEWEYLTKEIVERLSQEYCLFAFVGAKARYYEKYVDKKRSTTLYFGHPSPLNKHKPFLGSRFFTTINDHLKDEAINWRL